MISNIDHYHSICSSIDSSDDNDDVIVAAVIDDIIRVCVFDTNEFMMSNKDSNSNNTSSDENNTSIDSNCNDNKNDDNDNDNDDIIQYPKKWPNYPLLIRRSKHMLR